MVKGSTMSKDWILGFTEGEGSFVIPLIYSKPHSYGINIYGLFEISLHEDDREVLEAIRDVIGVGRVIDLSRADERTRGIRASDQARYLVTTLNGCLTVADFFADCVFRSKKGKDFILWVEGLKVIKEKRHLLGEGILEISRIRDQMNNAGKKQKHYHTTKEVEAHIRSKGWRPSSNLGEFI